jgi:hypothetical protein
MSTVGQKRDGEHGSSESNPTLLPAIVPQPPTTTGTPAAPRSPPPNTSNQSNSHSLSTEPKTFLQLASRNLSTSKHRHNKAPIRPIPRRKNNYLSLENSPKIAEKSNCGDHRLAGKHARAECECAQRHDAAEFAAPPQGASSLPRSMARVGSGRVLAITALSYSPCPCSPGQCAPLLQGSLLGQLPTAMNALR